MEHINDWVFLAFQDPRKRKKFRHPGTGNWVVFDSLPESEQARLVPQLHLQMSQPQRQQPMIDDGGPDMRSPEAPGPEMGDAGMGDAGMGGGDGGGAMAGADEEIMERGLANTGEVEFGEPMAMEELEARMSDYMARPVGLEDMLGPGGLGIVPVSLGAFGDPDSQHEGPDTDPEGEHMGCGDMMGDEHMGCGGPVEMEDWSFVPEEAKTAEEDKEGAVERSFLAPVVQPDVGMSGDPEMEPPPPALVRRMSQERMRDLGRGLMVAGGKSPRMQMMAIQEALGGLLDQLESLSDQPGREALRRRILLQIRPRVMRF